MWWAGIEARIGRRQMGTKGRFRLLGVPLALPPVFRPRANISSIDTWARSQHPSRHELFAPRPPHFCTCAPPFGGGVGYADPLS